MIGLIVLAVLCTISLIFNVLTLVCAARNALDQREAVGVLIDSHNHVARRIGDLAEELESAMNCLLTLDATAADSSAVGNGAE
jgi:hypothetical protein